MSTLRKWQKDALDELDFHKAVDFLLVATPGAGKTVFALTAAARESRAQVIVVVPNTNLRYQWANTATGHGLNLDPRFENGHGRWAPDFEGCVVTYQAVASQPDLYRHIVEKTATTVILDEVHHCGDNLAWGTAIRKAFDPAHQRLLLSGTPFRGDAATIPFVVYEPGKDGDPTSKANYRYEYKRALADGVVREIEFACFNGTAQWPSASDTVKQVMKDVPLKDEGRALRSALMVKSEWTTAVLNEAVRRLRDARSGIPNAGGLVIADTQIHARELAQRLQAITGSPVPVAISDDPSAHKVIDAFKASSEPWLVAVNMVSEGVDIRRLLVGVYATTSKTELFFRQAVGRFLRTRGDESDSWPATLFIPQVPTLVKLASEMEVERDHVLCPPSEPDGGGGDGDRPDPLAVFAATDGHHGTSIHNGDHVTAEEMVEADRVMAAAGVKGLSTVHAVKMLRVAGRSNPAATPSAALPDDRPLYQVRDDTLNRLHRRVKQHHRRTGLPFDEIWKRLNSAVGEWTVKDATHHTLMARHREMDRWAADAKQ